ncbi:MAG TPA: hypothetical protein PKA90_15515 [Ignavibacteria bacterium]|nr:hypothetical protein [Ignavibacteria bacterium]HMR41826.1 hypothetical protein [Ignavibacteria bacterium]
MKYRFLVFLIFFIILQSGKLSSRLNDLFEKEINAGDYRIFITYDEDNYFTGSIQVADKYNNTVFYADSFYTKYYKDTLTDLDQNGTKELVLDLGTGALMYDYNMLLIFDFGKKDIDPLEVHNAELVYSEDGIPEILSTVRLSPSVLGAGYSFDLKYKNGNLNLVSGNDSKAEVGKAPEDEDIWYPIDEYKKDNDECEEGSQFIVYFEAYLMQQKLQGDEEKGWAFFDKNYTCSDKETKRKDLKKLTDQTYSELKDPDSYRFGYRY